jgi:hypothetical protein
MVAPILVFFLAISSEIFQFISDKYKSTAETLRRKLDFANSFGWLVTKKEVAEVLVSVPERLQRKWKLRDDTYFFSKENVGAKRAMSNLEESSWWSKHLAIFTFYIYFSAIAFVVLLSFIALHASLTFNPGLTYIPKISKIVMSSIMLLFSIGSIKIMIGYSKFHRRAEIFESLAKEKQKQTCLSDIEAIRLWSEYHIARASSPLIPTVFWKFRRNRLNQLRESCVE